MFYIVHEPHEGYWVWEVGGREWQCFLHLRDAEDYIRYRLL